jgi:DNA-binding response OmpR family regulator
MITNTSLAGKTALVMDDEFLIASMIEDILVRLGADVVTATRCDEAEAYLSDRHVDFAVIDYQMRDVPSAEVWTALMERGIPFAFCTGSMVEEMRDRFPGILILSKPFSESAIVDAANALMTRQ